MPFGWEVNILLLVLTVVILGLGFHWPEFMKAKWYQGLCAVALGYLAWFGLIHAQKLSSVSDSVKWMFFIFGIVCVVFALMKILRLFTKEKA